MGNVTLWYWVIGAVAFGTYWFGKHAKGSKITATSFIYSLLLTFLGLATGDVFGEGASAAFTSVYALSTGLAGGTSVKTLADMRTARRAAKANSEHDAP